MSHAYVTNAVLQCRGTQRQMFHYPPQVRSISLNVRKNVSLNTLSQDVLLKEFSSIS